MLPKPSSLFVYWILLGLLNNVSYVFFLATAKSISEGGTAIVYMANTVPGLLIKWWGPLLGLEKVSYDCRLGIATVSGVLAFGLASWSTMRHSLTGQLLGVALVSVQIGLGEASLLALAGRWELSSNVSCLKAFAVGTGIAGPAGYLFHLMLSGLPVSSMLAVAISLPLSYGWVYRQANKKWLNYYEGMSHAEESSVPAEVESSDSVQAPGAQELRVLLHENDVPQVSRDNLQDMHEGQEDEDQDQEAALSTRDRLSFVLSLWPYTIPLFTVYAAEYACQAGAWTAMGLTKESRERFYLQSNGLYQAGSFLARSSGMIWTVSSLKTLWVLPMWQIVNLCFFCWVATKPESMWYTNGVLWTGAFVTGLLGGTVYIQGYLRVTKDIVKSRVELALFSVCVAEAWGVLAADVLGLYIQACLYESNGIEGAVVTCPLKH